MADEEDVALDRLVVDLVLQPRRGGLDEEHVERLASAPDAWPDIAVVEAEGRLVVIDGFHRTEAARRLGLHTVRIRRVSVPPGSDLRGLAFALNARHGRPLTHDDRKYEAQRLLTNHPDLSDREIARRCGLAPNTVGTTRERLESSGQITATEARLGQDGRTYSVAPRREPGVLPQSELGDDFANFADLLTGKSERRQQRRIASYLERLAVALDDQQRLSSWTGADDAVTACRAHVSEDDIHQLAERLGVGARRVLEVATLLKKDAPK